jgi:hypothetical protein
MKNLRTTLFLCAVLTYSAALAHADSISLGSFATGTTASSLGFSSSESAMNFAGYTSLTTAPQVGSTPTLQNGTASTYALAPSTVWAGPVGNSTWVGSTPASGPFGVNPPLGYYQYNTTFNAQGGSYNAQFALLADDTVEVLLDGTVLVPFGALGSDTYCAFSPVNCTAITNVPFSGLSLNSGSNTLTFIVEQAGIVSPSYDDPSGVDFTAKFASAAPEPSSLLLLATGFAAGAAVLSRRRYPI